jgi:hypothetical protein
MIDTDLKELSGAPPDRPLEGLEAQIWAGVAAREEAMRIRRRLVALQCGLVVAALVGSLIAGQYWHRAQHGGSLDVFSPRMPLSASTLLVGNRP